MLTGTEEDSDAIVLFAVEFEPTVVVEESEVKKPKGRIESR